MFDIVVVSEKPYVSHRLAPYLSKQYPETSTLVFNQGLTGLLHFAFPRGGEFSDYPSISAPQYQFKPPAYAHAHSLAEYLEVEETPEHRFNWKTPGLDAEALLKAAQSAKRFVYVADPNATSAHSYLRFLEYAGISDALSRTDAYLMYALDDKSLDSAMTRGSTAEAVKAVEQLDKQGEVKRYFEWNWNHNALVVMRPPLKAMSVPSDAVISKYELQLLYFLARNPDEPRDSAKRPPEDSTSPILSPPLRPFWTEGGIVYAMKGWKGSGKYERASLGSAASRDAIIERLYKKEFLTRTAESRSVRVTEKGHSFLNLLHPDCEDLDLPARLDDWMNQGLDASRPAIDRYVQTFFGKQIRFFGKNHPRK